MSGIPQQWKSWVLENLMKGVAADKIIRVMLDKGFAYESCRRLLGNTLSPDFSWHRDGIFYQQLSQSRLATMASGPQQHFTNAAQVFTWPDFLSIQACTELIGLTEQKVRPSELAAPSEDKHFRTSSSADLECQDHPLVDVLNRRIAEVTGLDPAWGEPIQAQRYQKGQEFKAHTDYFAPGSLEYERHGGARGQRSWTFMIYLNQDFQGGDTEFLHLNTAFRPVSGMALIWNNLHSDGSVNAQTLHHAHKVTQGVKYVITKWYRDRSYTW